MDNEEMRYPLHWPDDQPRTPRSEQERGRYSVSFSNSLCDLLYELSLMRATSVVVSSNVTLRRDGMPRAGAAKRVDDPGVAVYWARDGNEYVVACDSYRAVRSNLRAIGLTIHHLRRLEAAAPAFIAGRAYQGFSRLPVNSHQKGWWQVLGVERGVDKDAIKEAYRAQAKVCHPDYGGTDQQMADLNRARSEGLKEVGSA